MSALRLIDALAARRPDHLVFRGSESSWQARDVLAEISALSQQLVGTRVLAILADSVEARG